MSTDQSPALTYVLTLTVDEVVLLDGKCRSEIQRVVAIAKAARALNKFGLTDREGHFVAKVVEYADKRKIIGYSRKRIRSCVICGKSGGYEKYRSGPNKGNQNWNRPLDFDGVELATDGVVYTIGYATIGGCVDCVRRLTPILVEALAPIDAQVHQNLKSPDSPNLVRRRIFECGVCKWKGSESLMRKRKDQQETWGGLLGCPSCDAFNPPFGTPKLVHTGQFVCEVAA